MVISKDELLHAINGMPDKIDVEDVFDRIMLIAKIEQAVEESEKGLGKDWNEFKQEWLKADQ
jgi:hypothetical protein